MKCRVCREPAVIDIRRHNANFCIDHFLRLCRDQTAKAIDEFAMLAPGDRVLVEHKVYERLLTRLDAPRSYFFVHPCGLPIWRDPAGGLTFSTKFAPIARCPQCNDEIRLDDCAPLANGPAAFTIEVGPAFDEAVFQRMATVATLTSAVPRRFRVEAPVGPWMVVFLARQKGVQRTALEGYGLAAPLREAA